MEAIGKVVVKWPLGIHIRPATKIAKLLQKFSCEVTFIGNDTRCNPKSVMQLLLLEAAPGTIIDISAAGENAEKAVEEIIEFFNSYCDEEHKPTNPL